MLATLNMPLCHPERAERPATSEQASCRTTDIEASVFRTRGEVQCPPLRPRCKFGLTSAIFRRTTCPRQTAIRHLHPQRRRGHAPKELEVPRRCISLHASPAVRAVASLDVANDRAQTLAGSVQIEDSLWHSSASSRTIGQRATDAGLKAASVITGAWLLHRRGCLPSGDS